MLAPEGLEPFPTWIWSKPDGNLFILEDGNRHADREGVTSVNNEARFLSFWKSKAQKRINVAIFPEAPNAANLCRDIFYQGAFRELGILVVRKGRHGFFVNSVRVSNKNISECKLHSREILLENCTIGDLSLEASSMIVIKNCKIGKFSVSVPEGASDLVLSMESSEVIQLSVFNLDRFRDFEITSTKFSKRMKSYFESEVADALNVVRLDRVSFAMLHEWAVKNGHSKTAHLSRGHELAIEKSLADFQEKIILFFWGVFSNYGMSLWRPLVWLFILAVMFGSALFISGTALGVEPEELMGWRQALVGNEISPRLHRSVVGAVESVFTPFSVFSTRRLVVPESGGVAVLQFFYSYFCVTLLFLFGFSVRRRFKV